MDLPFGQHLQNLPFIIFSKGNKTKVERLFPNTVEIFAIFPYLHEFPEMGGKWNLDVDMMGISTLN